MKQFIRFLKKLLCRHQWLSRFWIGYEIGEGIQSYVCQKCGSVQWRYAVKLELSSYGGVLPTASGSGGERLS